MKCNSLGDPIITVNGREVALRIVEDPDDPKGLCVATMNNNNIEYYIIKLLSNGRIDLIPNESRFPVDDHGYSDV